MWFVPDFAGPWYEILLEVAVVGLAFWSAGHALLTKRDPRATLGWIVVCLALPFLGALIYWTFGFNRIRTSARKLRDESPVDWGESIDDPLPPTAPAELPSEYKGYLLYSRKVTRRRLVGGNAVDALHNGEQAYPAMLEAIAGAEHTVFLSSYIFDSDGTGRQFVAALAAARNRGVDVRVLVDGVGERYSKPRISTLLKAEKVPVARFLPLSLTNLHFNLRTHRKVLVVDGAIAFTGGMNIGDRHLAERLENAGRVVDVHFRLRGPIALQIEEAFLEDWCFTMQKDMPPPSHDQVPPVGDLVCRGILDGPNEDFERIQWMLLGVINAARERVRIMTPYFLPDRELTAILNTADLRGVDVEIILPEQNNLKYVHWASRALLGQLLERGVRVFYQPPPFVHTKLLLVDQGYVQMGSANFDARSLRLNFEFNVEILGRDFAAGLIAHFDEVLSRSHELTMDELNARSLLTRLRDSFCHLFSPYL